MGDSYRPIIFTSGDQQNFDAKKSVETISKILRVPKNNINVEIKDANKFWIAEQYHQFHDGFNIGENYPNKYNNLAKMFADKKENFGTCPNGLIGVGIGGL